MDRDSGQGQWRLAGSAEVSIDEKIRSFLESEGREKKQILKELLKESLTQEQVKALAPAIRDPSPRVSSRITSLLARWHLRDLFEEQLSGLKPGKQSLLRNHFSKISQKAKEG